MESIATEIARSRCLPARRSGGSKRTTSGRELKDNFYCHQKATFGIERKQFLGRNFGVELDCRKHNERNR